MPAIQKGQTSLPDFLSTGRAKDEAWKALIDWIAAEHLPFTTVKSPFFLQFVRMLQPRFNVYSDVTVKKDQGSHTGDNIAKVVYDVLKDFDLEKRISAITLNNASNNDTLMSFLEMHMVSNGIKFDAVQFHIRCLPHIANLAAKDFIKNTIGNDAGLIDSCGIDDNDDESSCVPTSALIKIQSIVRGIRKSPQRRDNFKDICILKKLVPRIPPIDVATRWSSTFMMLQFVIEYKLPINTFVSQQKQMRKYELDELEWNLLDEMMQVLKQELDRLTSHEIDDYLTAPVVIAIDRVTKKPINVLEWWKTTGVSLYPNLAKMARDYLSIPASSASVERIFSAGVDLVVPTRCSLLDETIRVMMCRWFWTWDRKGEVCPTFVEDTDVIEESDEPLDNLLSANTHMGMDNWISCDMYEF
ncbi:hypothetical protein EMCRGX_G022790 [Ephydatia muelleri]